MEPIEGVKFLQGDLREKEVLVQFEGLLAECELDLVICDMAPNMSGNNITDQARSFYLAELGLEFAQAHLKRGGDFLVKIFQGVGQIEFQQAMKDNFAQVLVRKPKASRDRSNEIYLLGRGRK